MSFLNLMQNKLKPREVNDALVNGGGSGVPDYSHDEVNTGVKWIDGRTIYMKSFPSSDWLGNTFYAQSTTKILNQPNYVDAVIDALIVTVNSGNAKVIWRPFVFLENSGISIGGLSTTSASGEFVLWYLKNETN